MANAKACPAAGQGATHFLQRFFQMDAAGGCSAGRYPQSPPARPGCKWYTRCHAGGAVCRNESRLAYGEDRHERVNGGLWGRGR